MWYPCNVISLLYKANDNDTFLCFQEEMDFEYAMTLHNAESQVQPPPCHRLSEYHTHDSDSPTTMLTRGMRQATRGQ